MMLAAGVDPSLVSGADARRRPVARTAPLLLEPPRLLDQASRIHLERGTGQVALIGLMLVAFAIVALTRLSPSGAATPSVGPSASTRAVASGAAPTPTPAPSVSAGPSVSVGPSPSSSPGYRTTYRVKKGDTLLGIAKTFGTTAARIRTLNGLSSSTLKIGQVLEIP